MVLMSTLNKSVTKVTISCCKFAESRFCSIIQIFLPKLLECELHMVSVVSGTTNNIEALPQLNLIYSLKELTFTNTDGDASKFFTNCTICRRNFLTATISTTFSLNRHVLRKSSILLKILRIAASVHR